MTRKIVAVFVDVQNIYYTTQQAFGGRNAYLLEAANNLYNKDPVIKERNKNPSEDLMSRICVVNLRAVKLH